MSYTALTPQTVTRAGITPTMTSAPATGAGNGVSFSNNGRRWVRVKNAGGSACNVTLNLGSTVDGQTPAAKTVTVAATTGDMLMGPFPPGDYNTGAGLMTIDFDNVTSVTVGVFELS